MRMRRAERWTPQATTWGEAIRMPRTSWRTTAGLMRRAATALTRAAAGASGTGCPSSVYAHEVANYLSWLYVGKASAYGTLTGIQGQVVESRRRNENVDKDTGARMEKCVWGDVSY